MNLWRRFLADRNGNMAILFAAGFSVSVIVSAFAVDAASLYRERRSLQNGVDLAVLAAARDPTNAATVARAVLVENQLIDPTVTLAALTAASGDLQVQTGTYRPDPALAPSARFVAGATPVNAVRVHFQRRGILHFARGWSEAPMIGAIGTATVTPQVSFSIGSRLASLTDGIANRVLNSLLGTNIALTALDYRNLLDAKVDAFAFLDALALRMGITAGTYADLLQARADHGEIAAALAAVLTGADRTAAQVIANAAGNNGGVPLSKLFNLGDLAQLRIGSGQGQGLFTRISALELLSASAGLSDGNRQVALDLGASLPGVLGLTAELAVGEPPQGGSWYAIGPTGTVVRTAQLRLRLNASVLGGAALLGNLVHLPLYIELAHAEGIVGSATCPSPGHPAGAATILTRPGAARVMVGVVNAASFGDFNTPPHVGLATLVEVKLLGLTVLKVLASSLVEIAQITPVPLTFSSAEIAAGTVKTAHTSTVVSSLSGSLLGNLKLQVPVLGLGLSLDGVGILLKGLLMPITPALDGVVAQLLQTLGLKIGEADVRVYGVRCTQPVLVG
ncbi:hypothetical protein VW29_19905 [Devosia limi DSM 17137]|uniref:Uncharacterized membrane protein n=1 Tax=Devosia limi DSM 17137 TaxID=1121477 RepID=A0A0F5L2B1_9HYPH|nr:pilus assembly protein TadG-related protein [Devosia limi]KKB76345.1 hypothetical protein VW29_19905 [Devosia limi DSM 17137]SHF72561.1 Uncharacterized membrane protein [Devosia limi DSM 17137]